MNMLSITKSCVTLCDPMDWSMPGFLVLHYLPEFPQTHVPWVSGAIQPSHPLLPPSPSALNLSQHRVFSNEPTFQMPGMLQSMGVTKSSIKNIIKNLKKNTIKNLNSNTLDTTSAQISKLIWRLSQGVPPENNAKDQRNERYEWRKAKQGRRVRETVVKIIFIRNKNRLVSDLSSTLLTEDYGEVGLKYLILNLASCTQAIQ